MIIPKLIAVGSISAFYAIGVTYAYTPFTSLNFSLALAGFFSGITGYYLRQMEVNSSE